MVYFIFNNDDVYWPIAVDKAQAEAELSDDEWATWRKVSSAIERLDEAMMMFLLSHFRR